MRKLELLCVGKIKESYFREGIAEYVKRLGRYCSVQITELPDCADESGAVETESKALLSRMDGYVLLSDLRGRQVSSEEFADIVEKAYLRSPKLQFVIGGSRGVSQAVRDRADMTVCFGKMTFPHRLMRLIATEQLYRAFTIKEGTNYHK